MISRTANGITGQFSMKTGVPAKGIFLIIKSMKYIYTVNANQVSGYECQDIDKDV